MSRRHLGRAALGVAALAAVGCHRIDLQMRETTNGSLQAAVSEVHVRIYEGTAVGVALYDGNEPIESDMSVTFSPLTPILSVHASSEHAEVVFYGLEPGDTYVHVRVDGEFYDDIPATVLAQP